MLASVYVSRGDANRIKELMRIKRHLPPGVFMGNDFDVNAVSFIEHDMDTFPNIGSDSDAATINAAIEGVGFVNVVAVKSVIGESVEEYNAFKIWADGVKGATGDMLVGETAVASNEHATAAYLLGAAALFDNEPVIEISEVEVDDGADDPDEKGAITLSVTVKDGENAVVVASEKVKEMFEATSSLDDWEGDAKLTPVVHILERNGATMRFKVTPGDGKAASAFLRIRK